MAPVVDSAMFLGTEPDYSDWVNGVSNYTRTVNARGESAVDYQIITEARDGLRCFDSDISVYVVCTPK